MVARIDAYIYWNIQMNVPLHTASLVAPVTNERVLQTWRGSQLKNLLSRRKHYWKPNKQLTSSLLILQLSLIYHNRTNSFSALLSTQHSLCPRTPLLSWRRTTQTPWHEKWLASCYILCSPKYYQRFHQRSGLYFNPKAQKSLDNIESIFTYPRCLIQSQDNHNFLLLPNKRVGRVRNWKLLQWTIQSNSTNTQAQYHLDWRRLQCKTR